MTIENTNLFSFKGAISRKNYFINLVIIYMISVLLNTCISVILTVFNIGMDSLIPKTTFILSTAFSFILLFFNIKKRIYDIKNGEKTKPLTIFSGIFTAIYCFIPFVYQNTDIITIAYVICLLSLIFIKGKMIPIKGTLKDEKKDNSSLICYKNGISKKNFIANNIVILAIAGIFYSLQELNNYFYEVNEINYHIANALIFTILFAINVKKRFFDIKNGENFIKQTVLFSILGTLTLCSILFNFHLGIICTLIAFLLLNIIYLSVKNGEYVNTNNAKGFNFTAFLCPWLWGIFNRIKEPLYLLPIFTLIPSITYSFFMSNSLYFSLKEALFTHEGITNTIFLFISIIILQIYYGLKANEWFDIEYKDEDKKQKNILPLTISLIAILFITISPSAYKLYLFKDQINFKYEITKNMAEKGLLSKEVTLNDYEQIMKKNNLKTWKDLEKYFIKSFTERLVIFGFEPKYVKEGDTYKLFIAPEQYNKNPYLVKLLNYINIPKIDSIESVKTRKFVSGFSMPYKMEIYSTVDDELLIDCNLQNVYYKKKPNYIDAYKAMKSCKIKNYTKDVDIKKVLNFTKRNQDKMREENKNRSWI